MKRETGKTVTVEISSINSRGEGVARHGKEHFVFFVPGALPGETVLGRISSLKKTYGTLDIRDILEASPHRRVPKCPWFNLCGGCSLQHADYGFQCFLKKRRVQDALMKELGNEYSSMVADCIKSPGEWHYRNKAIFPVVRQGKSAKFGFFRRNSHHLVPVDTCPILQQPLEAMMQDIPAMIDLLGWRGYDEKRHSGFLRHVSLRATKDRKTSLILIVREGLRKHERVDLEKLGDFLKNRSDYASPSVFVNINGKRGNRVFGLHTEHIAGTEYIEENFGGYRLRFGASSFFQVNPLLNERLVEEALSGFDNGHNIVELYSGAGTMTLGLAEKASFLHAAESWPEAAGYLKENLAENGFRNVRVLGDTAEKALDHITRDSCDALLLDPPRAGCSVEVRQKILSLKPERIVYVSCNPATLARDLNSFISDGYKILRIVPLDMFPQTPHVETVAFLGL